MCCNFFLGIKKNILELYQIINIENEPESLKYHLKISESLCPLGDVWFSDNNLLPGL